MMAQNPPSGPPVKVPPVVLIIDDEVGLRDMVRYGLKKRGFEVIGAANGEEGLALITKQKVDLVVCDIMMPVMGGIETLKRIKEQFPSIEVVMATGYATLETAIETMKNGAFDYITKPYSLSHLTAIFEKALEHRRLKEKVGYLEELNKLKSEFMATMSHELRTPLASILGFISLLLRNTYGDIPEKQHQILDRVDVNAKNLLQLINNILDLSKLSANRMTLTPEDFNFTELQKEVGEAMEPLLRAKKLILKVQMADELHIRSDRTKMKQILINLIGNAIKFTPPTGIITVSAFVQMDNITIEVRDTGIGIAPADIGLLFQEFKQLDGSTTREYAGTGLGLAITRKLIELMNGTITVESELGKGTNFKIHLPHRVLKETPLEAPVVTVPETTANDKVILSIDDDADVLKVLGDSLAGTGFKSVGALSGEEGLKMARQIHPELVTLDIMMPHMDGWSVLKVFKNDPQLKDIPIYIISIVENKALAISLGVTDYIVKPFTQEELIKKLKLVSKTHRPQLLVVDHDPRTCERLSQSLSQEGYEVEAIVSDQEAITRMKQLKPDVVFLDLGLPNMNGLEVLEAIGNLPTQPPAVIVMVDKQLTEEQERILGGRVDMIVQKETELHAMTSALRNKLRSLRKAA
jgi:signal transduction histidine kinase